MPENFLIDTSDIKPLNILCQRMVESQENIATNEIVDTLEEQALLEVLLEKSKPNLPKAALGLHYLLATPFRYPPLNGGSRFGVRNERGIFYGSLETRTLLHEVAYYTFVFLNGLRAPLPHPLKSRHTQFSVVLQADRAVLLNDPKFDDLQSRLRHLSDYTFTQQLGAHMRALGVQAFLFTPPETLTTDLILAFLTIRVSQGKSLGEKGNGFARLINLPTKSLFTALPQSKVRSFLSTYTA